MRTALAALVDTLAVLVLGYLGFRLAVSTAPCSDLGECAILTPMVIAAAVVLIAAYFGAGYLLWRRTPGERLLR
jgi:hypothetical protein